MANENESGGPSTVRVRPRLRRYYEEQVRARLQQQFSFSTPMRVPRMQKIVLNVGLGEATKNAKLLDSVMAEIAQITGQKPVTPTRQEGDLELRPPRGHAGRRLGRRCARDRMWEFLDRFINVAMPRIRDFRGRADALVRWAWQLHDGRQGAADLPGDRLSTRCS